ncbi:SRPBCC family protein [Arthrobacter sp. PsM3]|uniref:SRPBCC family protein n=1 Tax=Arthrobacter sp. PsM3 TaxID=3030531 RepID=UPI00263AD416|nr:SRPBCC family protein [Arthrobacter sp. PsM3]MDN4643340.1 SRPBCC family protein [Arthrobacter sp. PsM3]
MDCLEAHTLIDAGNSAVWEILTDSGNFPVWDSGIIAISGEVRNGGTIKIRTRARGRTRLRVEQVPGKVMTWTSGAPPWYSFVRTFILTPEAGMTRLTVKDELGPLGRLVGSPWAVTTEILTGFTAAAKQRAEILN